MRIENPTIVAIHDFVWHQRNGVEVQIQAMIGMPYRLDIDWACPCAIYGVDGRYGDIIGVSGLQALSLAIGLVLRRLQHLLDAGEILDLSADGSRLTIEALNALFGRTRSAV